MNPYPYAVHGVSECGRNGLARSGHCYSIKNVEEVFSEQEKCLRLGKLSKKRAQATTSFVVVVGFFVNRG